MELHPPGIISNINKLILIEKVGEELIRYKET